MHPSDAALWGFLKGLEDPDGWGKGFTFPESGSRRRTGAEAPEDIEGRGRDPARRGRATLPIGPRRPSPSPVQLTGGDGQAWGAKEEGGPDRQVVDPAPGPQPPGPGLGRSH